MKKFILFQILMCSLTSFLTATSYYDYASGVEESDFSANCGKQISYEVYGELLYLQPNGSDLNYAVEAVGLDTSIAVPAVSPNWNVHEINPNYHCGFEIGTKVLFHCSEMNLELNWERLHAQDSDTYQTSSDAGFMVGPFSDIGPNSEPYKIAYGRVKSEFDQVNLTSGKEFCFFNSLHTNLYGGIGFTRIKQCLYFSYSNVDATISRIIDTDSQFTGAGPQIGLDYDCGIWNNFSLTGSSTVSLFVGQMKNQTTYQSFSPLLTSLLSPQPQPNFQTTTVPNRTQLIPGFEQKIGLSYNAMLFNCEVKVGIGYQCQIYVDAVQTVDMTAPQVLPAFLTLTPEVGVFAVGFERTRSNYILSGPYASLSITF